MGKLVLGCDPYQQPKDDGKVVFEIRYVDKTVDENGEKGQEIQVSSMDSDFVAGCWILDAGYYCYRYNPDKCERAQQAGFAP